MKKLLAFILSLFGLSFFIGFSNALVSDCQTINYDGGNSICLSISKNGNTYTMSNGISCPNGGCSLACNILLPDSTSREVGACNGSFTWNGSSQGLVKIYTQLNGVQKTMERNYNFSAGTWGSSTIGSSDLNNFQLTTNRSNPAQSQWVDLTIKARN
ncbi:MAG: hypothetical protein M0P94_05015, partial [Candidatus Absconditabacterales bacterium]|nr:hypothetical protein [Candidatus Absconditabacterales bacterium]